MTGRKRAADPHIETTTPPARGSEERRGIDDIAPRAFSLQGSVL